MTLSTHSIQNLIVKHKNNPLIMPVQQVETTNQSKIDEMAENMQNMEEIEKQWAVKAFHHADTFYSLISSIKGSKLKLTR